MSVLVKGMKMPDNCEQCAFQSDVGFCLAMPKNFCGYTETDKRSDFCPLVALPDNHGRLVEFIDVVTTLDEDSGTEEVCLGDIMRAYYEMRNAPTIVESEDSE